MIIRTVEKANHTVFNMCTIMLADAKSFSGRHPPFVGSKLERRAKLSPAKAVLSVLRL